MLTFQQQASYNFIIDYISKYKVAPTTAEIAQAIGIRSRGVVHRYLKSLQDAGLIRLLPSKKRNIELLNHTINKNTIKLIGKIAAGRPIEAIHQDEEIEVSKMFIGSDRYALKVHGDSMKDDGIIDGDIVICQHSQVARNGQIVVALVEGSQATLKRIQYNDNGTITLNPSNSNHKPQIYPEELIQVQGLFIGLLRIAA
jgi:repressor LexA